MSWFFVAILFNFISASLFTAAGYYHYYSPNLNKSLKLIAHGYITFVIAIICLVVGNLSI